MAQNDISRRQFPKGAGAIGAGPAAMTIFGMPVFASGEMGGAPWRTRSGAKFSICKSQ